MPRKHALLPRVGALANECGVWVITHPQEPAYRAQSSGDSEAVSAPSGQTVTDLPGRCHSIWSPLTQTSG